MIYSLFISISVLMFVCIFLFRRDALAPAFLLNLGFWIASICACAYAKAWEFNNIKLYAVIMIGLIAFTLGSFITYLPTRNIIIEPKKLEPIRINRLFLFIYMFFQLLLYISLLIVITHNVGGFSIFAISRAIGEYYEANRMGSTQYSLGIINAFVILNMSGIYYLLYVTIKNIIAGEKNSVLNYTNIIMGIFGSLLNGTKTTFFMYGVAIVILILTLKCQANGWKNTIDVALFIKICIGVVAAIGVFVILTSVQGRTLSDMKMADVIASYLGAPMKNLELFLNQNFINRKYSWGEATFLDTYKWILGSKTTSALAASLYQYRWVNHVGIGNVYTMFMPIFNDFGIEGVFICLFLVGIFCQLCYNRMRCRHVNKKIDFFVIWYSYLSFAVIFSFFSNKFFEMIIARAGIYFILGLGIFDLIFSRFDLRSMSIKLDKPTICIRLRK